MTKVLGIRRALEISTHSRTFARMRADALVVRYRWLLVCFFLLPLSLLFDVFSLLRSKVIFLLNSAPHAHARKVAAVQEQVRRRKAGALMCTARPGWQTMSFRRAVYKNTHHAVKVDLVDVLSVNVDKQTVWVEPLVTMGQLSATLQPLGWTVPVVPEIDDLTVGGLVMGTGVESSSHRHGLFQHTCVTYELVLADGSLVSCTKDSDPDLFYSVPWSYGTLGFLTAVEIRIIPAKRYLKLRYLPVRSLDEAVDVFSEQTSNPDTEFVEGLMFSRDQGVIMTGVMENTYEPGKLNEIGRWYKPWFFKHVATFLERGEGTEFIPLREYFHRHTRSIFWELQDIVPFGNNVLFRWLLGWMMPPKVSLLKLTQTNTIKELYENNHIIQDMLVPMECLKESIELFHREVQVYPLWLCPMRLPQEPGLVHASSADQMYVDVGVYGVPKVRSFHPARTTRTVEAFVRKVRGFQMLYADTYATREEFEEMFDHSLYRRVRKRLGCEGAFPDVYDKVNKSART